MHLFDAEAKVAAIAAAFLALAGVVVAIAGSGDVRIIGGGLIALAVVIAVALTFYLVGRSEDIDRTRHPQG